MEILVITALSAAVFVLAAKLFSLKNRIYSISKQLDEKENPLITTQLSGDELEAVVKKINLMIEDNRRAKVETGRE